MSDAQTPDGEPDAGAPAAPEWAADEYLTSGRRFVRWNLVTLALGLLALGGGWAALQAGFGRRTLPTFDGVPAGSPEQK